MKNVPKLRFKGFSSEWQVKRLDEVTSYVDYRGKTPQKSDSGVFLVTAKNVRLGYIDYESSKEYIPNDTYEEVMRRGKPLIGDVLITTEAPFGNVASINREDIALAQRIIKLRGKENVIQNYYLKFYLLSNVFQKELDEKATGGTVKGIKGSILHKMKLNFPCFHEQTKIADFLTAIDDRISQLSQKCDGLAEYKKGVMQKIFSQELRFKDEKGRAFPAWDEKRLGDICKITTGKSNREDSSLIGEYTFFDRSQDIRTSDIFLFDCEAVIVAGEGQDFIPKHFIGKFDLHQRTYAIIGFDENNGKYIFYNITYFRSYFLSQAVGSTVKSLRLPMFEKMPIKLPCVAEQEKIAGFLSAVDEKISQAQAQLAALKQYKQGLLQQMFV